MREKLVKITPEIEAVLREAEFDDNRLVLVGKLDRALYVKVAKVLMALGGQWRRKDGAHIFAGDAGAIVTKALAQGGAIDEKRTFEAFDTPPELAARLVEMAGVRPGDSALEPSAGRGAIVQALRDAGARVRCLEYDTKAYKTLQNRFGSPSRFFDVHYGDFLNYDDGGDWKRIVMNPPFSKQQAVDHVAHALDLLAPTGTLVAVMPASVKTVRSKRTAALRARVKELGGAFVDLPTDSFVSSGTGVCTVVLVVNRGHDDP